MSAIIGHTTILHPSSNIEGIWKHKDLPPPVGKSPIVFSCFKTLSIMYD